MTDLVMPAALGSIFAGIALAVVVLAGAVSDRRAVDRSLASIGAPMQALPGNTGTSSFGDRILVPTLARFDRLGAALTPRGRRERLAAQLDLAGNPPAWSLQKVIACKALGLMTGIAFALLVLSGGSAARTLLYAACLGGGAFLLPDLLIYNSGVKRQERIQKSLPDALDLLTISVEAGLGFDAALRQVARNTDGPLAGEFFRVLQEMQMQSRMQAFRALAERTNVPDLRAFVSSLSQADQLGIPVGKVLREQSKEMRLKRRQRAEEQAAKVPVKILFPMVVFILPVLFVIVLAPAGMQISKTVGGG